MDPQTLTLLKECGIILQNVWQKEARIKKKELWENFVLQVAWRSIPEGNLETLQESLPMIQAVLKNKGARIKNKE